MADLSFVRPRAYAKMVVHPSDVKSVCMQPEMLASFTEGELAELIECLHLELNYRQNKGERNVGIAGKE